MKVILVIFLVLNITFPAFTEERFLLDTVTNVVNGVNNVVTTAQNTISAAQLVGQILWDNAFGPSLDLFLNCIYHFKKDN